MSAITRKQLLRGGVAGAAAIAALPFTGSMASAAQGGQFFHFHARLRTPSPGQVFTVADVDGYMAGLSHELGALGVAPLSGTGWASLKSGSNEILMEALLRLDGRREAAEDFSFHGQVLFASDPTFAHAQVKGNASLRTGDISMKWSGPMLDFAGSGVVIKMA